MNWREILGVTSDATLRDCKKAYANLIKQVRPDDDPERFMIIRNAYEMAQSFFNQQNEVVVPDFEPPKFKEKAKVKNTPFHFNDVRDENEKEVPEVLGHTSPDENHVPSQLNTVEVNFNSDDTTCEKEISFLETVEFNGSFEQQNHEKENVPKKETIIEHTESINQNNDASDNAAHHCYELLNQMYDDHNNRMTIESWEVMLNSLTLTEDAVMDFVIVNFLNVHNNFSDEIWLYLNEKFQLLEKTNFYMKHRIFFMSSFRYQQTHLTDDDMKEHFYALRNKLYYHFLELETHQNAMLKQDILTDSFTLFLDYFYYEMVLKFSLETNDLELLEFAKPHIDCEPRFVEIYHRYSGYFNIKSNIIDAAILSFEESLKIDGDNPLSKLGIFKSRLASKHEKNTRRAARKLSDPFEDHVICDHYLYRERRIKRLEKHGVLKTSSREATIELFYSFALILGLIAVGLWVLKSVFVFLSHTFGLFFYIFLGFIVMTIIKTFKRQVKT